MKEESIMKETLGAIALSVATSAGAIAAPSWTVDNIHSKVKFSVSHLVISEVEGSFNVYSGELRTSAPDLTNADVSFSVDVNSINTDNAMRDKHLKSDDFFNAEQYPTMTFKSTSWKQLSDQNYVLEGDLTIRNVTRHVQFAVVYGGTVKDGYGNIKMGFKATAVINRFDYGLKWNTLTEAGGATVGKDVSITLNLEFTQQKSS
jgi:polyisoprenoid-binding protein YceI